MKIVHSAHDTYLVLTIYESVGEKVVLHQSMLTKIDRKCLFFQSHSSSNRRHDEYDSHGSSWPQKLPEAQLSNRKLMMPIISEGYASTNIQGGRRNSNDDKEEEEQKVSCIIFSVELTLISFQVKYLKKTSNHIFVFWGGRGGIFE